MSISVLLDEGQTGPVMELEEVAMKNTSVTKETGAPERKNHRLTSVLSVWIVMFLLIFGSGPCFADDTDVQIDTTMNAYSVTAQHSFTGSLTVASNSNRYLAVGIALSADTSSSGSVMAQVHTVTWTVGSTTQTFNFQQGKNTSTGSNDTARSEIWELVAPSTGSGTLKLILDNKSITSETADSSPTGDTSVTGETIDSTPDGSTKSFSGTLSNTPVVRNQVTMYATVGGNSKTITDDGSGSLSGDSGNITGNIYYVADGTHSAGDWDLSFTTAPDNSTNITADYHYGKWKFSGTLSDPEVEASSVTFSATVGSATKTATDNGSGSLSGDSGNITGTITYSSGAWTLEYMTPPDSSTNITVDYEHQNIAQMVGGAMSFYNVHQTNPTTAGGSMSGSDTTPGNAVGGSQRDILFGLVATTGPASTIVKADSEMTDRWQHKNGTGNTDAFSAGATRPNVSGSYTSLDWTLGTSRKWAVSLVNIQPPNTPSFARLVKLQAFDTSRGTLIRWRTSYEVENLGFRIYRESNGERIPLNRRLIAGSSLFRGPELELANGRSYRFFDSQAPGRQFSTYWLEDVALDGTSTWNGPFLSEPMSPEEESHLLAELDAGGAFSPMLSELGSKASTTRGRCSSIIPTRKPKSAVSWAPAGAPAAKISISREGYYRVSRSQLAEAGFDPGPDPTNLQLLVQGEQVAIALNGINDGVFDLEDSLEFYGRGVDQPSTDTRVYWLVQGDEPGLRIQTFRHYRKSGSRDGREEHRITQKFYRRTVERKDHGIYVAALTSNGDRDNFYGGVITGTPLEMTLEADYVNFAASSANPPELRVAVQGFSSGEHLVQVVLNGHELGLLSVMDQESGVFETEFDSSWLLEGANILSLQSAGGDNDVSLIDKADLNYDRSYVAVGDELSASAGAGTIVRIRGFSNRDVDVFDVSSELRPRRLMNRPTGSSGVGFVTPPPSGHDSSLVAIYACSEDAIRQPDGISANLPSHWGTTDHSADLVIIAPPEFSAAAETLAAHRRSQGLDVESISLVDINDEFAYGEGNPEAIRDFLRLSANSWTKAPRWALLIGDATFDPRDYLGYGNFDFVPTHIQAVLDLKTAVDDWFGDLDEDSRPEIAIGRLPVRTALEADAIASKIIAYDEASDLTGWSRNMSLVAGIGDDDSFEETITDLSTLIPPEIDVEEINVTDLGADSARDVVLEAFHEGRLMINYNGHGSQTIWNNGILSGDDVADMDNEDRLPVVISMNCLNGFFHDLYQESLAETLLKADGGGAVAVWASSALTDPGGQAMLNMALYQRLFDGSDPALGDALLQAKSAITDPYVRSSWIFFGDPSMKLK